MTTDTVTLASGKAVEIRAPTAGELRGVKLLDVLQMDPAAHAVVLERVSDLTAAEFYALSAPDTMSIMAAVVGFFAPAETQSVSPSASKTRGK